MTRPTKIATRTPLDQSIKCNMKRMTAEDEKISRVLEQGRQRGHRKCGREREKSRNQEREANKKYLKWTIAVTGPL